MLCQHFKGSMFGAWSRKIMGFHPLDYPIATFLFWHVDDDNVTWDTYFCNFI